MTTDEDGRQRTMHQGRPIGQPVERYGRKPSTARYRCELCSATNIDDFHVEGTGKGSDSKGYKIAGVHDEEGFACGGRCWPWVPEGTVAETETPVDVALDIAVEGLGKIGGALQQGFDKIFKRP